MRKFIVSSIALMVSTCLYAQDETQSNTAVVDTPAPMETITVTSVRQRLEQAGTLANTIVKTEVVSALTIENKNAVNLTEAIDNSPGVKVSNECSMCGVKRIMLNGMKGEQTTILVDGLPVHTMVSGYYAVDAIPTTGVVRIEVARGAGASLIAPEAIGGVINIVSYDPTDSGAVVDLSIGEDGYRKLGFLGKGVSEDGATRATLIGQYDDRDQYDGDHNLVNEQPSQQNRSLTARLSHDIGAFDNLVLRYSNINSEVFGGPMLGATFADGRANSIGSVLRAYANNPSENIDLFENGDVNQNFTGNAWETTEWINTKRNEASVAWLKEWNSTLNSHLAVSYADHSQDSFYEGFDYVNDDKMWFYDARFNFAVSDEHLLTFGVDYRTEEMRSHSVAGAANPDYVADSFDYHVAGAYLQDTWQALDELEISMAVRADKVQADFVDPQKPGTELDETIVSPRIDMRYHHNAQWTSRLSAGRGYRAPLSFFETDHGILDGSLGFEIDINALERSKSVNYSLSYEGERLTSTASIAWTEVANLAALTTNEHGTPLLHQMDDKASSITSDISLGYRLLDDLTLNLTLENFNYNATFKHSYAIAPVEQRVSFNLDWDIGGWDFYASAVWIGSRDLSEYGYEGYDRLLSSNQADPSSKKSTDAPAYFTLDVKATYAINDTMSVYFGASNLLDYTQVDKSESPLFFDANGNFDVAYIYGPLRGREAYVGLKLEF
ncbi:TonB-dependent receptor [Shewanella mangrovi]|uniref:TonB-dependent receptor n=1 Tax=Shewanella mangrovi TaxID=1515746 RepID=A0A094JAN4_9GAMM|nr:TonB-dependent receptor [Shewanella mangrovi]KFZ36287.1 TonB-dependent receptor [Shewanella mangrovi]